MVIHLGGTFDDQLILHLSTVQCGFCATNQSCTLENLLIHHYLSQPTVFHSAVSVPADVRPNFFLPFFPLLPLISRPTDGAHTGKFGFDMFTHLRSSLDSPSWIDMILAFRFPPYTVRDPPPPSIPRVNTNILYILPSLFTIFFLKKNEQSNGLKKALQIGPSLPARPKNPPPPGGPTAASLGTSKWWASYKWLLFSLLLALVAKRAQAGGKLKLLA